ncbi:Uncharacterized protein TCM_012968 [Theobroma cacao]|uniref:Retroviral polymerase SH3-like domain-containing protein n=1 Tax=Theobroma cacao TaxID=3641 RepID=A0A061FX33_THECC|nr:Uncharacterized protein TCM_012968 [Theobroma cacao]
MFKMELGEDITSMLDRFTNITNKLSQLGKLIPEHEIVELKEEEEEDRKEAKEKKKSIALKASILEEELEELSCDDEKELALINTQPLGKFDAKIDEVIFLGYALNSKAYRVFNKKTLNIEESIHVVFDESNDLQKEIHVDDDDVEILEKQMKEMSLENNKNNEESPPRREKETPSLKDLQRTKNQHNDLPRS